MTCEHMQQCRYLQPEWRHAACIRLRVQHEQHNVPKCAMEQLLSELTRHLAEGASAEEPVLAVGALHYLDVAGIDLPVAPRHIRERRVRVVSHLRHCVAHVRDTCKATCRLD